jgi:hypothetical protein
MAIKVNLKLQIEREMNELVRFSRQIEDCVHQPGGCREK